MKINGVEFINDRWNFFGIDYASYILKINDNLTLSVQTKRDRITPFSVSWVEHNVLPIQIPKCKDWEFMTDREFGLYLAEQTGKLINYLSKMTPINFIKREN